MTRIKIEDASAAQLRDFARVVLGLEVGDRENGPTLRAKILDAGYGRDDIPLMDTPRVAPNDGQTEGYANRRQKKDKAGNPVMADGKPVYEVRINVHTSDLPGGDRAVPVSVNGRAMLIPRGEPVWVPEPYVEALDHAEEFVYPEYREGNGGLGQPRKVKSYPFSFA